MMDQQTTQPDNYYTQKYSLTATHSEVLEAAKLIAPGKTLDLGCGSGRNSLYLNLKGFDVTAWDKNAASIAAINQIIATEQLSHISASEQDLNTHRFSGQYDFILSTVVFMFLIACRSQTLCAICKTARLKVATT